MELYSSNEHYKLYNGNMLDLLEVIDKESIDSIVTDPPYELNFMGKGWDNSGIAFNSDTWKKCYDALKPGGYLLAFGGSRTYHRIACAIEDAGFEIRDTIMWLYGSGFPKSMNIGLAIDKKNGVESEIVGKSKIGKTSLGDSSGWDTSENMKKIKESGEYEIKKATNEWNGWGTALKPSFEPIIVARKPFKGSCVDNVIKYGVGGINIDECRVGDEVIEYYPTNLNEAHGNKFGNGAYMPKDTSGDIISHQGRFPANTILDSEEGENWRRYFYCAKASKKDRDEGLDEFEDKLYGMSGGASNAIDKGEEYNADSIRLNQTKLRKNAHPTVKPTELMQYLIRLVAPNGGTVLDPFNGSGSTGKAVMYENKERNKGYKYIGIELTEEYLPIAKKRIEYIINKEGNKECNKKQGETSVHTIDKNTQSNNLFYNL